jgi:hypothetical protein
MDAKQDVSLLDRLSDWLGYGKKEPVGDAYSNDVRPQEEQKKPNDITDGSYQSTIDLVKKQDNQTKTEPLTEEQNVKAINTKPSFVLPNKSKESFIDVQYPIKIPFREPLKKTPEDGVVDFASIPIIDQLVKSVSSSGQNSFANIEDKKRDRENINVADEFIRNNRGKVMDMNRADLSSLMALADFWTGGRSKMAASYKPPQSVDELYQTMMNVRQAAIKESDDADLKRKQLQIEAYKDLVQKPQFDMLDVLGRVYQGVGKDSSSVLKNINDAMQSGQNTYSNNATRAKIEDLQTRMRRDVEEAKLRQRADEFDKKINTHIGRGDRQAKQSYWDSIDRTLALYVAPKFTPKGNPLPVDRKLWGSKNEAAMGNVLKFADYVAASRGVDTADTEAIMRERLRALNDIAFGYNKDSWTDPELKALHDDYIKGSY